jgi:hypothetical protein
MARGSSVDAIGDAARRAAGSLYGPHQLAVADRNAVESIHERLKPFGPLYRAQAAVGELVERVAVDDLEQLVDEVEVALSKAREARKGTLSGVFSNEARNDESTDDVLGRAIVSARATGHR